MEAEEYRKMFELEGSHWWFVGLRELIKFHLKKISGDGNERILDAGCGTGRNLLECGIKSRFGVDFSPEAMKYCRMSNLENIANGSVSNLPFRQNSFNIVLSMDVLYHIGVKNDVEALKEIHRVLDKNGVLLLNLPSYNFLKSSHDEAIHTRKRYTKSELKKVLKTSGFRIEKIFYRNFFLFPLALVARLAEKFLRGDEKNALSGVNRPPALLNRLFTFVLRLENRLLLAGFSPPFGLSIYCIAIKE